MPTHEEAALMVKVARLYYENHQTQEEIATHLGLSRPKVSRLLQRARKEGIVQIHIIDPFASHADLEAALIEQFGLEAAVVVAGVVDREPLTRRRIGQAAAHYLEEVVRDGDVIGMGWGRTLYEMVQALSRRRQARISVVPLVGGLGQIAPSFQVNELARGLAQAFRGTWQPFYAPALLPGQAVREGFMKTLDAQEMAQRWAHLDLAVVGIGNTAFEEELQVLFVNYLDRETQDRLLRAGAVGDICVRFFDIRGRPCNDALPDVVGIELEQLRQARRVIGVAGGPHKVEAIFGALNGRYLRVLVTDETAARGVLELAQGRM